jgi:2-C-methyl-D-erythritol 4-phosphate cytidylyltransferase
VESVCILLCGGQGTRAGREMPKQYCMLIDKPVFAHSLLKIVHSKCFDTLVIVAAEEFRDLILDFIPNNFPHIFVLPGETRAHSVWNALQTTSKKTRYIAVHDAARPNVSTQLIRSLYEYVVQNGVGVIPGIPVTDTLKLCSSSGFIEKTVPREALYAVQTPQIFPASNLKRAYEMAKKDGFSGTDDASYLELSGDSVKVLPGEPENQKLTWEKDFSLFALFMDSERREAN